MWWMILFSLSFSVFAQDYERRSRSQARFIADSETFDPVRGIRVALDIVPDKNWHTYWLNPGDSGAAPILEYSSPNSVQFSEIRYPMPKRFTVGGLAAFGYDGRVLLITEITPTEKMSVGATVKIDLDAEWLVCEIECIPAFAKYSAEFVVGSAKPSNHKESFNQQVSKWPKRAKSSVNFREEGAKLFLSSSKELIDFFPALEMGLKLTKPELTKNGLVIETELPRKNHVTGLAFFADGSADWLTEEPIAKSRQSLLLVLLLAFLGGLILNLMPCVLPVIGIKMLAMVNENPRTVRRSTCSYVAGVLVSFLILAGVLISIRAGGELVGWGFQLQNPIFVLGMFALFFLLGANFLGWLPLNWIPQVKYSKSNHFMTGVLASLVATPCTAPFMGAALGAALSMDLTGSLLVFLFLGIGMSAPYFLFVVNPEFVRWLPKPGAWMETLRQALAFPMFGTAIWLLWVLVQQSGESFVVPGLGLVLVLGFSMWLKKPWTGVLLSASAVIVVVGLLMSKGTHGEDSLWLDFNPAEIERLRSDQPVFIDFTAAWCITCQVNKKVAFSSKEFTNFVEKNKIALIKADWTNRNPAITEYLQRFNRAGVPLYLFYVPGLESPKILPEVLTPSLLLDEMSSALKKE